MTTLAQWWCGLRLFGGHDYIRHVTRRSDTKGEPTLRLVCTGCGHETPGWTPGPKRYRITQDAAAPGLRKVRNFRRMGG